MYLLRLVALCWPMPGTLLLLLLVVLLLLLLLLLLLHVPGA